ncbi:hypothetical protein Tco_0536238 [Tanacetum coccineum]
MVRSPLPLNFVSTKFWVNTLYRRSFQAMARLGDFVNLSRAALSSSFKSLGNYDRQLSSPSKNAYSRLVQLLEFNLEREGGGVHCQFASRKRMFPLGILLRFGQLQMKVVHLLEQEETNLLIQIKKITLYPKGVRVWR